MPDYRIEAWFTHWKTGAEDELEEQFREFMKTNRMWAKGGPVVFTIYPA